MKRLFNLIDEHWIPIVDVGLVSLRDIFSNEDYLTLGGTPVEKIAITKLLLAIAQAAYTPENSDDWQKIGFQGLASKCLNYLEEWHDKFYLYGKKPFLQFEEVYRAEAKSFGTVMPDVATGNTTCLTQYHVERTLSCPEKALILLTQVSLALGGKKTDNSVILTAGYKGKTNIKGKPSTGKPGPAVGHLGFLHSFAIGSNLQRTIWLNLLTHEDIEEIGFFEKGVGVAPWEEMPEGEDCKRARELKNSLMGRLVPLSRFCLLTNKGLHLTEGISHLNYGDGIHDPSITTKIVGKTIKAIWTDPERKPWRLLPSIIGFVAEKNEAGICPQIKSSLRKAKIQGEQFGVWSGGINVSSNAGEQYVSGKNDSLESTVFLPLCATEKKWFEVYSTEMMNLDKLSKRLYYAINRYFSMFTADGQDKAAFACSMYWKLCERDAQKMLFGCDNPKQMHKLRLRFADYLLQSFDHYCPNHTKRQLANWVKYRPDITDYINQEEL